ncbi:MAG TPA: M1 family metallopeptidase [Candidatus Nitrosotalea sp.]|nr:M1 family metallopeptidase [Candidatus Nitrosotalea sp.]
MVTPVNYALEFEPDFEKFKFRGREQVLLKISKATRQIILNAAELEIKECFLTSNGKRLRGRVRLDEKKEEMVISLPEKISGRAVLEVDFVGTLNDKLVGFYRSRYEYNGKERHLATTQFEAADARRAFPCWDEPEAKATFDVSLLVDGNLTAVSNMPAISKKRVGKKTLYKFERTPVMSTYLLYLGVGEFEFLQGKLGKTLVRIITTKGKKEQGKMALVFTKQFLSYFQKYFKIPYPLPKLDMIAIPDFASGAMENWGAITFRETVLLYDPKTSSTDTLQHIAEVVAHELAHQWFGNLVTMKWWNDLWLNESFATFMATKAVDKVYPNWDFWDQFLISEMTGGMSLDSLKSSHPINVDVKSPAEVRQIFDEISYNKGGSVLLMLENYIGAENFRRGLYSYLKKHEYANATTEDLWNSLGAASRKPVRKMMDTWVRQVGYPVVEATSDGKSIRLSQKRFLLESAGASTRGMWMIPVSVRMEDTVETRMMTGSVAIPQKGGWFKVNDGQKGFYRVKYDPDSFEALGTLVAEKRLSNLDRWSIHNDLTALVLSGQYGLKHYLDFVKHYEDEDDYVVLSDIVGFLNFLYVEFVGEEFWAEIKEFNQWFMSVVFQRIGWDPAKGERATYALLRGMLISSLGRLEEREVVDEAYSRFSALQRKRPVNPDLRSAVYSTIAWNGDSRTYQTLVGMYRRAPTQEEKVKLLGSLANFKDRRLLEKTLSFTLSRDVRTQNLFVPVARMVANPYGKDLVWPWIRRNWKTLVTKFGVGNPLLNRIVGSVSVMADIEKEREVRRFFAKHHVPGIEMKLAQSLERIRIHARFLENVRKEFGQ